MTDLPSAGWYADPEHAGQLRYWDGAQWTEHRQPDAASTTAAPVSEPEVVRSPTPGPAPAGAWHGSSAAPVGRGGVARPVVVAIAVFSLLLGAIVGFTTGRLSADDGAVVAGGDAPVVRPGESVTLSLDGRQSVTLPFEVEEDRDVRIEVRSDDFDTTVTLYDGSGSQVTTDDDGLGEGLNSLIDRFLDAGDYEIEVAPFGSGVARGEAEVTIR